MEAKTLAIHPPLHSKRELEFLSNPQAKAVVGSSVDAGTTRKRKRAFNIMPQPPPSSTQSRVVAVFWIVRVLAAQQQLLRIRSSATEVTLVASQSLSVGIDSAYATDSIVIREAYNTSVFVVVRSITSRCTIVRCVFLCESHRGGNATELVGRGSIVGVQGQGEGVPQGEVHHRRAVEPTLLCDLQSRA